MAKDILERAALAAHEQYVKNEGLPSTAIDLGGIIEWGQIIFDLLKKCQEKKAQNLIRISKNPGLLQRVAANRAVAAHTNAPIRIVRAKAQALLDVCSGSSAEELQELIDTVDD